MRLERVAVTCKPRPFAGKAHRLDEEKEPTQDGGPDKEGDLGPPVVPFLTPLLGEGSPTKVDYRKKGTLIPTSLLEDLGTPTM